MTKHRSVVTGWDPARVNPDGSTGRPKGVQTAADMRIHATYDVLAEGVFAAKGVPAITGSPTNSASISPFMAAIEAPAGGFYIVSIDAPEDFSINMANVGAVNIYVQQQDYQVDPTHTESEVVIGVVYGANPVPYNSLLLFTTTITAQTSTNGLTFTPVFKFTGAASGVIRVPDTASLDDVAVVQSGIRALALDGSGEWFYALDNQWHQTTVGGTKLEATLNNFGNDGSLNQGVAIKPSDIRLFSAQKTVDQNSGVSAALTIISWQIKDEYRNTNDFSVAANSWTAPTKGWVDMSVVLSIINQGTVGDDTMWWGAYKNGVEQQAITDNWRYISSGSGVETTTNQQFGFKVNAGDVITMRFGEVQNTIFIGGTNTVRGSRWIGRFTPDFI